MATVVEILARLKADTTQFQSAMQGASQKMQSAGKAMTSAGKKLSMTVTAPIVGLGTAAVVMANDFEASMAKIEGLVGVPADEIRGMQDELVGLASQYGATATDAAEAMFFITSAGLRGSDAMDVLEASLKGAAVGLGDVTTIADLATSAMNAYGSDVLSATGATDVLAAAVREGKLEASELSGAMGQVLPIASAMGVQFHEVGAAMAAMSRTGTNAAQSSTQLRGIMNSLLKPTKQAEAALAGMGMSSEALRKQIREEGLYATLVTLTEAFDGNEAATAEVFGNVRALAGVLDLMGANADTTGKIFDNMTRSAGIGVEAMGATADTGAFRIKQAVATLKNSLMELGQIIAPVVADIADRFRELVEQFAKLPPETKKIIVIVSAAAAAVGPLLIVAGQLTIALGALNKAMWVLSMNPLTIKIALVVAAIAGLVLAVKYAWENFEWFRVGVMRVWEAVQEAASRTVDFFQGTVWPIMQRVFEDIKTVALLLWENGIKPAWEGIQSAVDSVVADFLEYVWPNLQKVFKFIGDAARALYEEFIKPNWEKIQTAVAPVVAWFQEYAQPILEAVFTALGTAVSVYAQLMAKWWGFLFRIIGPVVGWFVDYVGPVIMFVLRSIWTVMGLLVDFTIFYWKAVVTVVSAAVSRIVSVVQGVTRAVTTVATAFMQIRQSIIDRLTEAVAVIQGIPGRILSALSGVGNLLYNIGRSIIEGLLRGLRSAVDGIRNFFSGLTDLIPSWKGPASRDRKLLHNAGQLVIDGFITGMESRRKAVKASLAGLSDEVGAFGPQAGGRLMTVRAATPTMGSPLDAGAGRSSGGIHIENLNVSAAPGERADSSVPRNLRRMAWVAGLDG